MFINYKTKITLNKRFFIELCFNLNNLRKKVLYYTLFFILFISFFFRIYKIKYTIRDRKQKLLYIIFNLIIYYFTRYSF